MDVRDKEGPRSFARIIHDLGDGDVHADLSADLHALVSAIRDQALSVDGASKSKGVMTVKITCECDARGIVGIHVDSAVKTPKRRRPKYQAWVTGGGNLTTEHPRQVRLPLQEVGRRGVAAELPDEMREAQEV